MTITSIFPTKQFFLFSLFCHSCQWGKYHSIIYPLGVGSRVIQRGFKPTNLIRAKNN
jgi:hypothetical protein